MRRNENEVDIWQLRVPAGFYIMQPVFWALLLESGLLFLNSVLLSSFDFSVFCLHFLFRFLSNQTLLSGHRMHPAVIALGLFPTRQITPHHPSCSSIAYLSFSSIERIQIPHQNGKCHMFILSSNNTNADKHQKHRISALVLRTRESCPIASCFLSH